MGPCHPCQNPDSISRTFLEQLVLVSDWSWIQRIWTGHCCAQPILCRHYSIWLKHYLFQNRHHGKHFSFYRVWENCKDDLVWLLCQLWRNLWSLSWDQLRLYRGDRLLVLHQTLQKLQSLKSTNISVAFHKFLVLCVSTKLDSIISSDFEISLSMVNNNSK